MAYSLETLDDIRKSLIDTIAMVERENAKLTAKIDSLLPSTGQSPKTQDDDKLLEEFSLMKNIHGMSFKNVTKEILADSSVKVTADVFSGKEEECSLDIIADADGVVRDFTVGIEDTSTLMEIKRDLGALIEDVNLSFTLKAIASFSRMSELRSKIIEDLQTHYEDYFDIELRTQDSSTSCAAPESIVVSAHSRSRRAKYFEVAWHLRWNHRKTGIEHVFIAERFQGITRVPRVPNVEPQLRRLEEKHFFDGKCSKLAGLWVDIAELVAQG